MKRMISVLIISLLIFTACSTNNDKADSNATAEAETTVATETQTEATTTEPEATATEPETTSPATSDAPKQSGQSSKTANFYANLYESEEFSLHQHMDLEINGIKTKSVSVISRKGEKYASNTEWVTGDERNGLRLIFDADHVYSLDAQSKTYWVGNASDIPNFSAAATQSLNMLRSLEFVSGEAEVDGEKYQTETFVDQGITLTYFFQGDDLKFFENSTEGSLTRVYIDEAKQQADDELFEIPSDFTEVESPGAAVESPSN